MNITSDGADVTCDGRLFQSPEVGAANWKSPLAGILTQSFLDDNDKIKDAFQNTNPQVVYKKGQTLKRQLVSTKHKPTKTTLTEADSFSIIYLITCTHCKLQYVGQTNRKLKDRLNDHKSNTKRNTQTAISIHFRSASHNITHLQIIPIEQIEQNNQHQIIIREQFWMNTLQTKYPKGLNNYPIDKTNTTH